MRSGAGTSHDRRMQRPAYRILWSTDEIQDHLEELHIERVRAMIEGLSADRAYMADLDDEIATMRAAYVGAAVTELAVLRANLSGAQFG